MKNFFYTKVIWHHTAAFADIFNDMQTFVYDIDGNAIGEKKIPVYLYPKEKIVAQLQRGNWDTDGSIVFENYLPCISIVWNGIRLDQERMRGQRNQRRLYVEYEGEGDDPECGDGICKTELVHTDFQTVPYKLSFEVTFWAKYMDDMAQMLENTLTFFHPELYVSLPEKGVLSENKIKIEKTGENLNFVYELNQPDRRVLQSNLSFEMECNFYKPENPVAKPIKRVYIDIADVQSASSAYGDTVSVEVSGGGCFVDLDFNDNLRSFIKQFDLENEAYSAQRFNELNGLPPQPRELEYPSLTDEEYDEQFARDPNYGNTDFKVFKAREGQQNYVIMDSVIQAGDVIRVYIHNPYREDQIGVESIDVSAGQFELTLTEAPSVEGYDVAWRIE